MFTLTPTQRQEQALNGPETLESLRAADFLGKQDYIDTWIEHWLVKNDELSGELPLCVSESIICDSKLKRKYRNAVSAAVVRGDIAWVRRHHIVPVKVWNFVDFGSMSDDMFDALWEMKPVSFKLCAFLVQARRLRFWKRFVDQYGPTPCLRDAVQGLWPEGTAYCLAEGADVSSQDFVRLCIRNSNVFRQITDCNPPATKEAYEEFLLQSHLRRVPDIALVEQWFWIHGFK